MSTVGQLCLCFMLFLSGAQADRAASIGILLVTRDKEEDSDIPSSQMSLGRTSHLVKSDGH